MAIYNLTNLTNAEHIGDLMSFGNEVSQGILMIVITLAVTFILLMVLKKWEFLEALASTTVFMFVATTLLALGDYLSIVFPLGFLFIAAISVFLLYMKK